jgi:Domain of unknown function (DUF4331)
MIQAWASTSRAAQVDRMAIPAINTALIPTAQKDAFNLAVPAGDAAGFQTTVENQDQTLRTNVNAVLDPAIGPEDGGPAGNLTAAQVADFVMPDVVTIDTTQPIQFTNGRRLTDDVIDVALKLVLNRSHAAITDAINGNDVQFLSTFPYVAPPHQPAAAQQTATPTPAPGATPAAPAAPAATPVTTPAAVPASGGQPGDGVSETLIVAIAVAGVVLVLTGAGLALKRRIVR